MGKFSLTETTTKVPSAWFQCSVSVHSMFTHTAMGYRQQYVKLCKITTPWSWCDTHAWCDHHDRLLTRECQTARERSRSSNSKSLALWPSSFTGGPLVAPREFRTRGHPTHCEVRKEQRPWHFSLSALVTATNTWATWRNRDDKCAKCVFVWNYKKITMKLYTQAVHKSKKLTMHSTTWSVLINFQHFPPQKVKILTVSLSSGHAIVVCQFPSGTTRWTQISSLSLQYWT